MKRLGVCVQFGVSPRLSSSTSTSSKDLSLSVDVIIFPSEWWFRLALRWKMIVDTFGLDLIPGNNAYPDTENETGNAVIARQAIGKNEIAWNCKNSRPASPKIAKLGVEQVERK